MSTNTEPIAVKPKIRAIFKGWKGNLLEYKLIALSGEHIGGIQIRPNGTLEYTVHCHLSDEDCFHGDYTKWLRKVA